MKVFIDEKMESLNKCAECYSNETQYPNDWFTMVCAEPHIIVWVKIRKEYLPAKLMSIDGSKVHVRVFDDEHSKADVLASKCSLYSERYPGKMRELSENIKKAKKVVSYSDLVFQISQLIHYLFRFNRFEGSKFVHRKHSFEVRYISIRESQNDVEDGISR